MKRQMPAPLEAQLDIAFPISYFLENSREKSRRGILVLHGFSDHARSARRRLLGGESFENHVVLAPNALFPAPVRTNEGYKEAYSWYFRDPVTGRQMTTPEFAASAVLKLVALLRLEQVRWTIVAFSQGGFFAPFLKRAGLNVGAIVAVGSGFRREAYEGLEALRVYAIHGEEDDVVPIATARASFAAIQEMGYGVEFNAIPALKHSLNDEGRALVRAILERELDA